MSETLVIRTDGTAAIGTGHVMRCLALAQAWQDQGGSVIFAMAKPPPALQARLAGEQLHVEQVNAPPGSTRDARTTKELADRVEAEWVVVDGYQFGAEYQKEIMGSGHPLLFIDDYGHCEHYYADVVLNQNAYAREDLYRSREPCVRLLLGMKYVLLRREFEDWRGRTRVRPDRAGKVLVTLGGGDRDNVTLEVIKALVMLGCDEMEGRVVVGAANPHLESLQAACEQAAHVEVCTDVTDMPAMMAWADFAVAAGGSTCYELAFMGLPAISIVLAANQGPVAEALDREGALVNLGSHNGLSSAHVRGELERLSRDPARRTAMTEAGRQLVDGEGAARVCMALRGRTLRLRPVQDEDCRRLWEWANDPQTRAAAFTTDPIPWESHAEWFACRRRDPNSRILIALDRDDAPVGQIRFDASGLDEAEIDVSVDPSHRGKGYGSLIIDQGAAWMFARTPMRVLHAYVRSDNAASIRAFEKAGFHACETKTVSGVVSQHHVREKHDG